MRKFEYTCQSCERLLYKICNNTLETVTGRIISLSHFHPCGITYWYLFISIFTRNNGWISRWNSLCSVYCDIAYCLSWGDAPGSYYIPLYYYSCSFELAARFLFIYFVSDQGCLTVPRSQNTLMPGYQVASSTSFHKTHFGNNSNLRPMYLPYRMNSRVEGSKVEWSCPVC